MFKGVYKYIKLSIKGKKLKILEIIGCPQTYSVLMKLKIQMNPKEPILKNIKKVEKSTKTQQQQHKTRT